MYINGHRFVCSCSIGWLINVNVYHLVYNLFAGYHNDFGKREVTSRFNLGTRSNLPKLKKTLIEREFIEETESGLFLSDPLFVVWFKNNMM